MAGTKEDVEKVKRNIVSIYEKKKFLVIALCSYYAGMALQDFRTWQSNDEFWTNQTNTAWADVFTKVIDEPNETGFFIAHAVEYGVYLELANDRKHEALRPVLRELLEPFLKDLKRIWQ